MTTPLARLHNVDAVTRRVTLLQVADEESADALPNMIVLLEQDPAPEVRLEVARILATWEQPDTVVALVRALEGTDGTMHDTATISLADLKSPESVPALLPYVDHTNIFVRAIALRGLRELRMPESEAPVPHVL